MDSIKNVFSTFTSKLMSESTKLWSQLIIKDPSIRSKLFTNIIINYLIHQNNQIGLFLPHPRKDSNVSTLKMVSGPTQMKESMESVNPSIPYIILIDFIEEHYEFYCKIDNNVTVIIAELMITILKSTMSFRQFPSCRPAWIRIITFSMDLISSLANQGIITGHQKILWKHLVLSIIELFSKHLTWNIQNVDILKLEISLMEKCIKSVNNFILEFPKISLFIIFERQYYYSSNNDQNLMSMERLSRQSSRISLQDGGNNNTTAGMTAVNSNSNSNNTSIFATSPTSQYSYPTHSYHQQQQQQQQRSSSPSMPSVPASITNPLSGSNNGHYTENLELLRIFLLCMQHDRDRILIWLGSPISKASWISSSTWRKYVATAKYHSTRFAMAFVDRFKLEPLEFVNQIASSYGNVDAGASTNIAGISGGGNTNIGVGGGIGSVNATAITHSKFSSPEEVYFFIKRGLPINKSLLEDAPPIYPIVALCMFRHEIYGKDPVYLNYAVRSLESYRPDLLFFYIPQIVQMLRHDSDTENIDENAANGGSSGGYIKGTITHIAKVSSLFAHQIIWNLKANAFIDELATTPDPCKAVFENMIDNIKTLLGETDSKFYHEEFAFFDRITGISGALKPFIKREKWEKKAKIDEELRKIKVDPLSRVYLPSNPESVILDIDYDSGRPLQSHAKAPFMATFRVQSSVSSTALSSPSALMSSSVTFADGYVPVMDKPVWQSAIFKVGDDSRQDMMTLQLITIFKNIFESVGLGLYLNPYRVVATGPGSGVIEFVSKSISRDQLGREKINSLYEYFLFKFGDDCGERFQNAREAFVRSMAGYSIICYLLAIKDRHNGNILIDDEGHIIHIDFGFILDMSPGGINVESAPFKLTFEMLQVMGGRDESSFFQWFRDLCCQGFLVVREYADLLCNIVESMTESNLPCFIKSEGIVKKLRYRFRLDLNEADARQFMSDLVYKSCENVRTVIYDRYQLATNGIPY